MAPLWVTKPTGPARCSMGTVAPERHTLDGKLTMPMQLGPMRPMPACRHNEVISAWATTPSPPSSANPAECTTTALTPAEATSSRLSRTARLGTLRMAQSTGGPGISDTRAEGGSALNGVAPGIDEEYLPFEAEVVVAREELLREPAAIGRSDESDPAGVGERLPDRG